MDRGGSLGQVGSAFVMLHNRAAQETVGQGWIGEGPPFLEKGAKGLRVIWKEGQDKVLTGDASGHNLQ